MAWWLKALTALLEDLDLIPSNPTEPVTLLELQEIQGPFLALAGKRKVHSPHPYV